MHRHIAFNTRAGRRPSPCPPCNIQSVVRAPSYPHAERPFAIGDVISACLADGGAEPGRTGVVAIAFSFGVAPTRGIGRRAGRARGRGVVVCAAIDAGG